MRLVSLSRPGRVAAVVILLSGALAFQTLTPTPASALTSAEHSLLRLVNADRRSHGLRPLRLSAVAVRISHNHSRRMAKVGKYFDQCMSCILYQHGWSYVGENTGFAPTMRAMNRFFMHSPPHRANILSRHFTRVGVGVVRARGTEWVTELFFKP